MTKKKRNRNEDIKQRLETMEIEIKTLLGGTRQDSKPIDLELPIGRLSRADAIQMQNMAELNKRQLEIKLEQVECALISIDEGSYGSCRSCKGEIHPDRLDARPETPFCIDCQEAFEQQ